MDFPYITSSPRVRVAGLASLLAMAACATAPKPPPPTPLAPLASASASASSAPVASAPEPASPLQKFQNAAQLGLCSADQLAAANDGLGEVDRLARQLPDDMSPASDVIARVSKLLSSPCLGGQRLIESFNTHDLHTARSAAVRRWWESAEDFFRDTLAHANAVHFMPSLPKVLAPETLAADDPLRTIVCPAVSAVCDPLAEGARIDLTREIERVAGPHVSGSPHGRTLTAESADIEACAREKPASPDDNPLMTYIACVTKLAARQTVLPIAHYRSPKGWLVMRGRRGHYQFCDEIRAYDLATGAAYIASRCGGLVLQGNGSVDQGKTSQQSQMQTQVGTLSVDSLRRLALMLWLKDSLDRRVQPYAEFALPEGIPFPTARSGGSSSGSSWGSSAQTRITFRIADGKDLRTGQFTWPDSADTADQIIDDLIVATEATFQPGCPPAALPQALVSSPALGGVSPIDASAESLRASTEALTKAMSGLRAGRVCRVK